METTSILRPEYFPHKQGKVTRKKPNLDRVLSQHRQSITAGLALTSNDLQTIGLNVLQGNSRQVIKSFTSQGSMDIPDRMLQTAHSRRSTHTKLEGSKYLSSPKREALTPTHTLIDSSFDLVTRYTGAFLTTTSKCSLQIPTKQLNESSNSVDKLDRFIRGCSNFSRNQGLLRRKVTRCQRRNSKKSPQHGEVVVFKKAYIRASVKKFRRDKVAFIFGKEGKGRFIDQRMRDPLKPRLRKSIS